MSISVKNVEKAKEFTINAFKEMGKLSQVKILMLVTLQRIY